MVELRPLLEEECEEFIRRNQAAFLEALAEEMPEGQEVISREEILESLLAPKLKPFRSTGRMNWLAVSLCRLIQQPSATPWTSCLLMAIIRAKVWG
nr:hypothetical protein [Streptococcus suis]